MLIIMSFISLIIGTAGLLILYHKVIKDLDKYREQLKNDNREINIKMNKVIS